MRNKYFSHTPEVGQSWTSLSPSHHVINKLSTNDGVPYLYKRVLTRGSQLTRALSIWISVPSLSFLLYRSQRPNLKDNRHQQILPQPINTLFILTYANLPTFILVLPPIRTCGFLIYSSLLHKPKLSSQPRQPQNRNQANHRKQPSFSFAMEKNRPLAMA